eukprot:jgi/Astpho2/1200/fgenesh1_pg.00022_%23_10_t
MHLMITCILLGMAMLTGEVVAIPLQDLEQSGCLEFREYHSSAWEQRWLADVDNLQKDACNAMKQDAELGKHWVEQAHLAHESNYLPNNSLWSYFEYANACHEGQHLFIPIEPLVGLLRHPFGHPDCFIEDYSDLHIENRSYVLPMPLSSQLSSRIYPGKRYLIEAGCSNVYNGSLEWFVEDCRQVMCKLQAAAVKAPAEDIKLAKNREKARVDAITLPEVVLENWAHLADMPVTQLDLAALAEEEPMPSHLMVLSSAPPGSPGSDRRLLAPPVHLMLDESDVFMNPLFQDEPETFDGGFQNEMGMPGAASAGPAGEPEMDYNLGGYDAWDAPEVPEQFGDVAADNGPPPGADDPALAMQAGASAKESDRAPAQHGGQMDLVAMLASEEDTAQRQQAQQLHDAPARQAQAKSKKRKAGPKVDEQVRLDQKVFRAWLSDTSETVTFRPKRTCLADIANTLPADVARQVKPLTAKQLLTASPATAAMGGWEYCPELLQLFHDAIAHKPGPRHPASSPNPASLEQQEAGAALDAGMHGATPYYDGLDELGGGYDPGNMEADFAVGVDAAGMALEDVEPERLRREVTPAAMNAEQALQLGLTPGSSTYSGLEHSRRQHSSMRLEPGSRPGESGRSSQGRCLPNVNEMMDGVLDEAGEVQERLSSLLGPPEGLTASELLEESARPTPGHAKVLLLQNAATARVLRGLRERFAEEQERQQVEVVTLSLFRLTRGQTRIQAARLFYQVCVVYSNDFIKASQAGPYHDILMRQGVQFSEASA